MPIMMRKVVPKNFTQMRAEMDKRYRFDPVNYSIHIFGEIDEWWGFGMNQLAFDLKNAEGEKIDGFVNSGGGSLLEGIAMRNLLKGYSGEVVMTGVGMVASIATVILLAGDRVRMASNSFFMIHEPVWWKGGNAEELESQAETLKKMRKEIVDIYLNAIEKNGKLVNDSREDTEEQLNEWMRRETWFSASEALERGFIDEVVEDIEFMNEENTDEVDEIERMLENYQNVPINFSQSIKNFKMAKKNVSNKSFVDKLKALFIAEGLDISNAIAVEDKPQAKKKEVSDDVKNAIELLKANGIDVAPVNEEVEEEVNEELEAAKELLEANGFVIQDEEGEADEQEEYEEEEDEEDAAVAEMKSELQRLQDENSKLKNRKNGRSLGKSGGSKTKKGGKVWYTPEQSAQFDKLADLLKKRQSTR